MDAMDQLMEANIAGIKNGHQIPSAGRKLDAFFQAGAEGRDYNFSPYFVSAKLYDKNSLVSQNNCSI